MKKSLRQHPLSPQKHHFLCLENKFYKLKKSRLLFQQSAAYFFKKIIYSEQKYSLLSYFCWIYFKLKSEITNPNFRKLKISLYSEPINISISFTFSHIWIHTKQTYFCTNPLTCIGDIFASYGHENFVIKTVFEFTNAISSYIHP